MADGREKEEMPGGCGVEGIRYGSRVTDRVEEPTRGRVNTPWRKEAKDQGGRWFRFSKLSHSRAASE